MRRASTFSAACEPLPERSSALRPFAVGCTSLARVAPRKCTTHRTISVSYERRASCARRVIIGCVRILVVDDDRSVRDALRRALTLGGYEVEAVEDGKQALSRLSTSAPDAVVL